MTTYLFEFRCGKNFLFKRFVDRKDAFAHGTLINADVMREVHYDLIDIDLVWANEWETPKELVRMYNEYKTEQ